MVLENIPDLIRRTGKLGYAIFSKDGIYRYYLLYRWAPGGYHALFGMQNPSTADPDKSDRTVTRCIGFAKRLKCNSLAVVNMAAGIATKPADLLKLRDPVGRYNTRAIGQALCGANVMIAGWGALSFQLRELFSPSIRAFTEIGAVRCLGLTQAGDPRHPLYLHSKSKLIRLPRQKVIY